MECTYGDRSHDRTHEHIEEFAKIIQRTLDRGGNVVVPAFAVGRTQEILYFIRKIKEEGLVTGHDGFLSLWTARWLSRRPMCSIKHFRVL